MRTLAVRYLLYWPYNDWEPAAFCYRPQYPCKRLIYVERSRVRLIRLQNYAIDASLLPITNDCANWQYNKARGGLRILPMWSPVPAVPVLHETAQQKERVPGASADIADRIGKILWRVWSSTDSVSTPTRAGPRHCRAVLQALSCWWRTRKRQPILKPTYDLDFQSRTSDELGSWVTYTQKLKVQLIFCCMHIVICNHLDNFALYFSPLYLVKLFKLVCVLLRPIHYVLPVLVNKRRIKDKVENGGTDRQTDKRTDGHCRLLYGSCKI